MSSHDEAEYCNCQIEQTDCRFAELGHTKKTGSNSTEHHPKATKLQLSKVSIRVLLRNKEPQQRGEKKLIRLAHLSIIYFEFVWFKGLTISTYANICSCSAVTVQSFPQHSDHTSNLHFISKFYSLMFFQMLPSLLN